MKKFPIVLVSIIIALLMLNFYIQLGRVFLDVAFGEYDRVMRLPSDTDVCPNVYCWNGIYDDKGNRITSTDKMKYVSRIYTLVDDTIYYSNQFSNKLKEGVILYAFSVKDEENIELCSASFKIHDSRNEKGFHSFEYERLDLPYNEMYSFYHAGSIIITDLNDLLKYDIGSNEMEWYKHDEYEFPETEAYLKKEENSTVLVVGDSEFPLDEDRLNLGNSMKKILGWKDDMTYNGESQIEDLFKNVQIINGKIYITGQYRRYLYDAYFVVMHYDIDTNCLSFVKAYMAYERVDDYYCYLIDGN